MNRRAVSLVGAFMGLLFLACSSSNERAVASAAILVNAAVREANALTTEVVAQCDMEERAALDIEPVEAAEARIRDVRASCDQAFKVIALLGEAVRRADEAFFCIERGECQIDALISAAMALKQQAEQAAKEEQRMWERIGGRR